MAKPIKTVKCYVRDVGDDGFGEIAPFWPYGRTDEVHITTERGCIALKSKQARRLAEALLNLLEGK